MQKKVVQDNNLQKNVRKYAKKKSSPVQNPGKTVVLNKKNCKKKNCPRQQFVKAVSETKIVTKKVTESKILPQKKLFGRTMCTMSKSKVIQNNDFFQEKLSETKICDKSI